MFIDPVTQQAMDIDIDTQADEYEWLLINIPDIKLFSVVEKLIQNSLHKVTCDMCFIICVSALDRTNVQYKTI